MLETSSNITTGLNTARYSENCEHRRDGPSV